MSLNGISRLCSKPASSYGSISMAPLFRLTATRKVRKKVIARKNLEADVFPPRRIKAICDETKTVLAAWSMSGNAHCARNVTEHLKPLLDRLAQKGIKVKMRIDAGFYGSEVLDFLESYSNVSYIIGVPQRKRLAQQK